MALHIAWASPRQAQVQAFRVFWNCIESFKGWQSFRMPSLWNSDTCCPPAASQAGSMELLAFEVAATVQQ